VLNRAPCLVKVHAPLQRVTEGFVADRGREEPAGELTEFQKRLARVIVL
jgi:hypothetical protein